MVLITRKQWDGLSARVRGYVLYLQAELPGSELKGLKNPYLPHTKERRQFEEGQEDAVLEVQDLDG